MIYSPGSHPRGVYDILLSDKYNQSYIKNVLSPPSFIMASEWLAIFAYIGLYFSCKNPLVHSEGLY